MVSTPAIAIREWGRRKDTPFSSWDSLLISNSSGGGLDGGTKSSRSIALGDVSTVDVSTGCPRSRKDSDKPDSMLWLEDLAGGGSLERKRSVKQWVGRRRAGNHGSLKTSNTPSVPAGDSCSNTQMRFRTSLRLSRVKY